MVKSEVIILSSLLIIILTSCMCTNQDKEINTAKMKYYDKYIGKDINLFLKEELSSDYKDIKCFDKKPAVLSGVIVTTNDDVQIEIEITDFNYIIPYNIDRKWDIELVKKENISSILILF